MSISRVAINDNSSLEIQAAFNKANNPLNSYNIGNNDRFISSINTREIYDLRVSFVSLFSLSGGVELLKELRNEKDPAIRNAVTSKLVNKLAKEIKDLKLYGLFFLLSDKDLRQIAKNLKGVCNEIDLMLKDGLVQLDLITALNYAIWVKGFVDQYGNDDRNNEENKKTKEIRISTLQNTVDLKSNNPQTNKCK